MAGKICSSCKRPYGNVPYADPGYQPDGKMRYPIDTPAHVAAAKRYIAMPRCYTKYDTAQLAHITSRIERAEAFMHVAKNKPQRAFLALTSGIQKKKKTKSSRK